MEKKTFTIYFTSDLHGYIYPTDYRSREIRDIGLFKCASQFRKDGNTLVIDGGDILQGSPLGAFCHDTLGNASRFAEMMNRCGYDYVTLGNHDFNYGMPYLDTYLDALHARCVCENVRWDGAGVRFPSRIHVLENGLRIGIVGIVTDYVNIWERPEHLSGIAITDPVPAAKAALEALKDQVDVTLCIYHGGFERDLATGRVLSATHENVAYRLCQELDFDLLLTGHQHMTVHGQTLNHTFVVQPTDRGQEFLRIQAVVSDTEKHFSSETIPAGGPCRKDWIDEFAGMEHGALAGPGGGPSPPPAAAGHAAADGGPRQRPPRSVQRGAALGQRRTAVRRQPGQRRGRPAPGGAQARSADRLPLHQHPLRAGDHRQDPAAGHGAQRRVLHPGRGRHATRFRLLPCAEG